MAQREKPFTPAKKLRKEVPANRFYSSEAGFWVFMRQYVTATVCKNASNL